MAGYVHIEKAYSWLYHLKKTDNWRILNVKKIKYILDIFRQKKKHSIRDNKTLFPKML